MNIQEIEVNPFLSMARDKYLGKETSVNIKQSSLDSDGLYEGTEIITIFQYFFYMICYCKHDIIAL